MPECSRAKLIVLWHRVLLIEIEGCLIDRSFGGLNENVAFPVAEGR